MGDRPGRPQGAANFWVLGLAVAGLCLSLGRVVGFVPFVGAGQGAGPNGFELTFRVAGLVVVNVSPVWVSCGWSVRTLLALYCVFFAGGHTAPNAPDLFRPPKLRNAGPG